MQFTKLRLLGFKSFVDPTELAIAPGLTGVVGPNGCGKSNLLEALRWVMGENRPTAMRGGGMEDVIFDGSASRPARNYAEVSLSIDNRARLAPAGFNTQDTLDVVRRITRDAGSAYKTNGKEARARDVQMLFADASTGSHSPALVRQGQISELINAKPQARRRVLEEAAGISGLYQRRHEAELKLNGTETNLARVEDVLDQLETQLKSLARQARQAARYREIAEELRTAEGLLLYRRWREAEGERATAAAALTDATKLAGSAQLAASQAGRSRAAAEGRVPALREEEAIAGAVLARLRHERDALAEQEARARATIAELEGRIVQLGRDIAREQGLNKDAGETIGRLDWECAALLKAAEGHDTKLETARDAARDAASALQDEETALDQMTEDAARLAARHQAAQRRLSDAQSQVQRCAIATAAARASTESIKVDLANSEDSKARAEAALRIAQQGSGDAEAGLLAAEAQRTAAQAAESEARAARAQTEGETTALRAETAALARLLAREAGDGRNLLERIKTQKGYEAALGAALADDLKAPEIGPDGRSGWAMLEGHSPVSALPDGAEALAARVDAPGVLGRRLAQIGIVEPAMGAALQAQLRPGQRLVSLAGDLWRWDGFRAAADDAPSAAALRLQQKNRLADLQTALEIADRATQAACESHETTRNALEAAQAQEGQARRNRKAADEAMTAATRAANAAEAAQNLLSGKAETLAGVLASRAAEDGDAAAQLAEARAGMTDLGDVDGARAAVDSRKITVEAARLTMLTKRSIADDLRREGEARARRMKEIATERASWTKRLDSAAQRIDDLKARLAQAETDLGLARETPDVLAAKRDDMARALDIAEARRKTAADALAAGETALRDAEAAERSAERAASEAREARARAEAVGEAAAARAGAAETRVTEETGQSPATLLESLGADPDTMPASDAIEIEVAGLKRQREALGAVNLRAEEDSREVQDEFDALATEKNDLQAAVDKLRQGINNLNREGRTRLLVAFEEVNKNFTQLFRSLFGGGDANLVLVESDDPLEAGLELMCQPPGKKLSTLSLLSGGEQTLTALSLIFAVFLANPSPICVLDEVDAPLDDANVTRFCDLLDEMTGQTDTRFLIITHHAVTMGRMDRLFGVTMAEQGVSQLVSVDLRQAEELIEG